MAPAPDALRRGRPLLLCNAVRLFVGSAVGVLFVGSLPGRAASLPEPGAPTIDRSAKTHTLFVGTDLSIEREKTFFRVKDISDGTFVITVDGRPEFIPGNRSTLNLKIEQAYKLSPQTATITNFLAERAYSPANDPQRRWVVARSQMWMLMTEQASAAQTGFVKNQTFGGPAAAGGLANFGSSLNAIPTNMGDPGTSMSRAHAEEDESNFDAMELNFKVSSDRPLNHPFMLVIARYRERGSPPGTTRNWIHAASLQSIDSQPRKVRVYKAGFPFGFILEDVELHLYNVGREVATNLSRQSVGLTNDQTFQYLLKTYLANNATATLPATVAMANFSQDVPVRLTTGQGRKPLFVRVTKAGHPVSVFVDEECSQKLTDPYVESLVKELRFKPALKNGSPVDGVARFKMGDLATAM